jgi:hypothetical protein
MNFVEAFISTLLQTISDINILNSGTKIYNAQKQSSLTDITKIARVEPLVVVSKDCLSVDYMPDVMNSLVNIFSGYYLQAVAITARVDKVKVIKVLDALNPDRDHTGFLMGLESSKDIINLCQESYKHSLPFISNERAFQTALESITKISLENESPNKVINEVSNLAVGKMLNVTISVPAAPVAQNNQQNQQNQDNRNNKIDIPVLVRLTPSILTIDSIMHVLALKTEDQTMRERFHAWRAGRITFIKDLILCQDLIDSHKKALMQDSNGVISEISRRANNSKVFGLLSGNPSLASASNIFVITEEVARQLELKLGGKLSNPNIRKRAFENTYAMIITVLDRDRDRIVFYHRGIANGTDLSIREIKSSNKGSGPDINDILKALLAGNQPTF